MASYTDTQINVWLRGLLAIAWADGDFSTAEQATILDLTQTVGLRFRALSYLADECGEDVSPYCS